MCNMCMSRNCKIVEQEEVGGVTRTEMWTWAIGCTKPCCLSEGFSTETKCVNMHRGTWGSTSYIP